MNSLTLIGALFFFGGLLIFSFKLISYNKRKYGDEGEKESSYLPSSGMNMVHILAIILILMAIFIIYLFGD
ncbi:MAG: hypothetical protein IIB95_02115 [Candidatus Marinimicrobia bacterium]|nr:hypothetical protein [Candidatus Neomarinimicrobiota bacterium]MCH7762521.1 hypothetical protein [Candidatus Neomarinimicrobiota bacterium]